MVREIGAPGRVEKFFDNVKGAINRIRTRSARRRLRSAVDTSASGSSSTTQSDRVPPAYGAPRNFRGGTGIY